MLVALFLLIGVLVTFCCFAFGNDAVHFNSTCVETETCGFSETERILHKLVGKIDSMDAKFDAIDAKFDAIDAKFDAMDAKFEAMDAKFEAKFDTLRDDILASEKRIHLHLHDQQAVKTQVLREASRTVTICESEVTAHFVLLEPFIFGISVAHFPCYIGDSIPDYISPCANLDVSIWSGCPPEDVSLLNITGRVAKAEIGNSALALGLTGGVPRIWEGIITGHVGKNTSGRHFTGRAYAHAEELICQGSQRAGMSGGPVLNGNGYLGVVRACDIDGLSNSDPIVVPVHLFEKCIWSKANVLQTLDSCRQIGRKYNINPVPKLFGR